MRELAITFNSQEKIIDLLLVNVFLIMAVIGVIVSHFYQLMHGCAALW